MSMGRIMPGGSWSRKLVEDGRFQARDSGETRMIGFARDKIDAGAPNFVERVCRSVDHSRKGLDALQFAHWRYRQSRLDGRAQTFVVDGADEAARQTDGGLLEGQNLKSVTTVTTRREPALPHGEAAMNNQGGSMRNGHERSPSGRSLLPGRRDGGDDCRQLSSDLPFRALSPHITPP
jgi:hypothetical protein